MLVPSASLESQMGTGSINPSSIIEMDWHLWDDCIAMQTSTKMPPLWPGLHQEEDQSTPCSMEQ